jgi:hypothetical protein
LPVPDCMRQEWDHISEAPVRRTRRAFRPCLKKVVAVDSFSIDYILKKELRIF